MTHDEIVKKMQREKDKQNLTLLDLEKKIHITASTIGSAIAGDSVRVETFEKVSQYFGMDVDIKRMRREVFESINNSDDSMMKIQDETGVSIKIMGEFLIGRNISLYSLLDLMDHFKLEF